MRDLRASSLLSGIGLFPNRLLVVALLAAIFTGFLCIAQRMKERAGLSSQVDVGIAVGPALAVHLVSVAIFARTIDGGFGRRTAFGRPGGTTWHLLPGKALTGSSPRAKVVPLPQSVERDASLRGRWTPVHCATLPRRGRMQSAISLEPDRKGGTPDTDGA